MRWKRRMEEHMQERHEADAHSESANTLSDNPVECTVRIIDTNGNVRECITHPVQAIVRILNDKEPFV